MKGGCQCCDASIKRMGSLIPLTESALSPPFISIVLDFALCIAAEEYSYSGASQLKIVLSVAGA